MTAEASEPGSASCGATPRSTVSEVINTEGPYTGPATPRAPERTMPPSMPPPGTSEEQSDPQQVSTQVTGPPAASTGTTPEAVLAEAISEVRRIEAANSGVPPVSDNQSVDAAVPSVPLSVVVSTPSISIGAQIVSEAVQRTLVEQAGTTPCKFGPQNCPSKTLLFWPSMKWCGPVVIKTILELFVAMYHFSFCIVLWDCNNPQQEVPPVPARVVAAGFTAVPSGGFSPPEPEVARSRVEQVEEVINRPDTGPAVPPQTEESQSTPHPRQVLVAPPGPIEPKAAPLIDITTTTGADTQNDPRSIFGPGTAEAPPSVPLGPSAMDVSAAGDAPTSPSRDSEATQAYPEVVSGEQTVAGGQAGPLIFYTMIYADGSPVPSGTAFPVPCWNSISFSQFCLSEINDGLGQQQMQDTLLGANFRPSSPEELNTFMTIAVSGEWYDDIGPSFRGHLRFIFFSVTPQESPFASSKSVSPADPPNPEPPKAGSVPPANLVDPVSRRSQSQGSGGRRVTMLQRVDETRTTFNSLAVDPPDQPSPNVEPSEPSTGDGDRSRSVSGSARSTKH